jgi:hypothetical protein
MPAITLGVADIESRLRAMQTRLNTFVVVRLACGGLSVVCFAVALGLALGWHHRLAAQGSLPWALATMIGAIAAATGFAIRRRWFDLDATTQLVDRQAELTDRLTTLVDLHVRPRPSRLAPLLVAQAIALMPRWQPHLVAPIRIPRSAYALAAALLALGAATLIAPEAAPPAASDPPPRHQPRADARLAPAAPQTGSELSHQAHAGISAAAVSADGSTNDDGDSNDAEAEDAGADAPPASVPRRLLAALPEKLQQAMAGAFYAQKLEPAPPAGTDADNPDASEGSAAGTAPAQPHGSTGGARPGQEPGDDQTRPGTDGKEQAEGAKPKDGGEAGKAEQPHGSAQAGHDDNNGESGEPGQDHDGKAPLSGGGSSPSSLFDPQGTATALNGEAQPRTFKLTITSFLQATQQHIARAKRNAKRVPGGATGDEPTAQTPPSDRQLNDDVLRKAEIPPEYEDLVRRVYSERTIPDEP